VDNKRLDELDKEWLQLIEELMKSTISKNQFKEFLELKKREKEKKKI
jgi:XRE family transcriptional regulator, master regulator for biofilm formation